MHPAGAIAARERVIQSLDAMRPCPSKAWTPSRSHRPAAAGVAASDGDARRARSRAHPGPDSSVRGPIPSAVRRSSATHSAIRCPLWVPWTTNHRARPIGRRPRERIEHLEVPRSVRQAERTEQDPAVRIETSFPVAVKSRAAAARWIRLALNDGTAAAQLLFDLRFNTTFRLIAQRNTRCGRSFQFRSCANDPSARESDPRRAGAEGFPARHPLQGRPDMAGGPDLHGLRRTRQRSTTPKKAEHRRRS